MLHFKASQKLGALSRLKGYLGNSKKSLIFNSIIKSQFSYCPLVWMFCSRTSNNIINSIHERALRIILEDYSTNFSNLLQRNNDLSIHHRNIQCLMIEIFKIKNNLAPPIMTTMFTEREIITI